MRTRMMIHATKQMDSNKPGTTPPMSSLEIEMPDKEPSKTVKAEGGMSMSTAPMAMMGPVAMVG